MRYEPASGVAPRATPITLVAGDSLDIDEPVTNIPAGATLLQAAVTFRRTDDARTVVVAYVVTVDASPAGRLVTDIDGVPHVRITDAPANTRGFLTAGLAAEDLVYDCVVWVAHPGETSPRERTLRKGLCTVISDVTASDTLTVPLPGSTAGPLDHVTIAPALLGGSESDTAPIAFVLVGFDASGTVVTGGVRSFVTDAPSVLTVVGGTGIGTRQGPGTAHVTGSLTLGGITRTAVATVSLTAATVSGGGGTITPAFFWAPSVGAPEYTHPAGLDAQALHNEPNLAVRALYPRDVDEDAYAFPSSVESANLAACFPSGAFALRPDLTSTYDRRVTMVEVTFTVDNVAQYGYNGGIDATEHGGGYSGVLELFVVLPDVYATGSNIGKSLDYEVREYNAAGTAVVDRDGTTLVAGTITLSGTRQHVERRVKARNVDGHGLRNLAVIVRPSAVNGATAYLSGVACNAFGDVPPSWVPNANRLGDLPIHRTRGLIVQPSVRNLWGEAMRTAAFRTVRLSDGSYDATKVAMTANEAPSSRLFDGAARFWQRVTLPAGAEYTIDPDTGGTLSLLTSDGTTPSEVAVIGAEFRPFSGTNGRTLAQLADHLVVGLRDAAGVERSVSSISYIDAHWQRSPGGAHGNGSEGARRAWGNCATRPGGESDTAFIPFIRNTSGTTLVVDLDVPACQPTQWSESRMGSWPFVIRPPFAIGVGTGVNNETYASFDHGLVPRHQWTYLIARQFNEDLFRMVGSQVVKFESGQGGPTGSASLGYNCGLTRNDLLSQVVVDFSWATQTDRPDLSYVGLDGLTHANPNNGDNTACGVGVSALGQVPAGMTVLFGALGTGRKTTGFVAKFGSGALQIVRRGVGPQTITFPNGDVATVGFSDTVDDGSRDHNWMQGGRFAIAKDRDHTSDEGGPIAYVIAHPAALDDASITAAVAHGETVAGTPSGATSDPLAPRTPYPVLVASGEVPAEATYFDPTDALGEWHARAGETIPDLTGHAHALGLSNTNGATTTPLSAAFVAASGGDGPFVRLGTWHGGGDAFKVETQPWATPFTVGELAFVLKMPATLVSQPVLEYDVAGVGAILIVHVTAGGGGAINLFDTADRPLAIPAGTFVGGGVYELGLTLSGTTAKLYINGAQVGAGVSCGPLGSALVGARVLRLGNAGGVASSDLAFGAGVMRGAVLSDSARATERAAVGTVYGSIGATGGGGGGGGTTLYDVDFTTSPSLSAWTNGADYAVDATGLRKVDTNHYLLRTGQSVADLTLTATLRVWESPVALLLRAGAGEDYIAAIIHNGDVQIEEAVSASYTDHSAHNFGGATFDGTTDHTVSITLAGTAYTVAFDGVTVGSGTVAVTAAGMTGLTMGANTARIRRLVAST